MNKQSLNIFTDYQDKLSLDFIKHKPNLTVKQFNLDKGELTFYPSFFNSETSDFLFEQLDQQIQWQQDYIKFYGRVSPIPRLTSWYGDEGKSYTYSGIKMNPHSWIKPLLLIKEVIELISQVRFNSVLLNLYRNGKDSVAWHSDDEPELGENPIIASVSFGETRKFSLKPRDKNNPIRHHMMLNHGSLLLMKGETQKYWLHQIPKTTKSVKPRINLTFRAIYD